MSRYGRGNRRTALKRKFGYLGRIASSVGGRALEEFNELLLLAASTQSATTEFVKDIRRRLKDFLSGNIKAAPGKRTRRSAFGKKRKQRGGAPAKAAPTDKVSQTVKAQLALLEAAAKGDGDLKSAYDAVARKLDTTPRSAAMLFARTQGKFRRYFVKRAVTQTTASELAKLYSAITGKTVTTEEIVKEVT